MTPNNLVGLDFESYSSVDLLKHGLHRYVNSPDFQPLIAVTAEDNGHGGMEGTYFDFVEDFSNERTRLIGALDGKTIVAHNAGFEQAVLGRMGIDLPSDRFIDSAVLARAAGAAGKLEAAGPQLLGIDKMAAGYDLIKLFSIPGKYQEQNDSSAFDPRVIKDHPNEWEQFAAYCAVDVELSLRIAELELFNTPSLELINNSVTMDMNNTGWHVDMRLVQNMRTRYLLNLSQAVSEFHALTGAVDLNLNSHPQLVEWCAQRGVKATSFDEAHVARLIKSLNKKLESMTPHSTKSVLYNEVLAMLKTKQVLGGSSLKKLETIVNTVGMDGRLHDQYLHIGAGATYRTTGRGVQMQNLKRLNGEANDMAELYDLSVEWDNDKLAANLRQVFTATDVNGFLIVGDFRSVESRGLAWQAGEDWKTQAYANGEEVYKAQAAQMFHKSVDLITKDERQLGKVGELACGYGAAAEAVKDFAEKMGLVLSIGEATKLVSDWRTANPKTVDYWWRLDAALHAALTSHAAVLVDMPHGFVRIDARPAPKSLRLQVGDEDLKSLRVSMFLADNTRLFSRVIHGAHEVGRNIHYWKPSERKTGDLWTDEFTNPKTKRLQKYSVYGGKLAGLLTQSLCREVFFTSLREVHRRLSTYNVANVRLVGQFHDEIVLDWAPGNASLDNVKVMLNDCMTTTILPEFPLEAEIKHDYRYTK